MDSAIATFSKPNIPEEKQKEHETDNLFRKIGQLEIENEFLKKKVESNTGQIVRREMVERGHPLLSLVKQCIFLSLSRSGLYYESKHSLKYDELCVKEAIDRQYLITPYYGIRRMKVHLDKRGFCVSRKRIDRYYKEMRITAIYPKPRTTQRNEEHKLYPYLLRNIEITRCIQVVLLAYFTPINAFLEPLFQYQIHPYSGASPIPFHKRVCNVHFYIFVYDLVKCSFRHCFYLL